jgi:hypothetical protein
MIYNNQVKTITISLIVGIIIYLVFNNKNKYINKNKSEIEFEKKIKLLDQMIKESKKNIKDKINLKEDTQKENINIESKSQNIYTESKAQNIYTDIHPIQPIYPIQPMHHPIQPNILPIIDPVIERDRAVLDDQLYPPLGRTDRPTFDHLITSLSSRLYSYPTRGSPDTFRLIAYLVNNSDKKDMWKLFGRQKYPGSSQGEYYAIQIDDRKSDMKITIKDEMMPNEKIRDIYGLPNEVTINSPLFNSHPYKVIELDKADLTSPYL